MYFSNQIKHYCLSADAFCLHISFMLYNIAILVILCWVMCLLLRSANSAEYLPSHQMKKKQCRFQIN